MNKMVINHLEKLFVTNDAATIIRELDVEHPAAKMMILASQMMEQEVTRTSYLKLIFKNTLVKNNMHYAHKFFFTIIITRLETVQTL